LAKPNFYSKEYLAMTFLSIVSRRSFRVGVRASLEPGYGTEYKYCDLVEGTRILEEGRPISFPIGSKEMSVARPCWLTRYSADDGVESAEYETQRDETGYRLVASLEEVADGIAKEVLMSTPKIVEGRVEVGSLDDADKVVECLRCHPEWRHGREVTSFLGLVTVSEKRG